MRSMYLYRLLFSWDLLMSSRIMLLGVVTLSYAVPCLVAQDDVFLREERKLDPANKAVLEALPKSSEDYPLTPQLKTDIEIMVRHAIYPLTDRTIRTTPNRLSQTVDACETRI